MSFKPNTGHLDVTKERVAGILREHGLLSAIAFVNAIYDDIRTNHQGEFSEQNILASARRNGVPEDEELWAEVFSGFQDYDSRATRSLLIKSSELPINAKNLANELHRRLRDDPQSLALRPEAYAKQQQTNQRRMWINAITGDGKHSTYLVWASNYGGFKWLPCSGLENEADEMLGALAQRVPEWRKQITGGYQKVEAPPQTDSLGELNSKPEHVERENDEFLQFPGSDPPREYSIRECKSDLRNLLFLPGTNQSRGQRRVAAVNRLLSGRKYGE